MGQSKSASRKTPIQLFIINAIALVGVGVSVLLAQHFYEVHNGTSGFKSFCNISQTMNCDVVAASPHAELFFGLPLASFAAGWFLALFLITLIAHNPFWRREALRLSFGLSLFGTFAAIPTLFIMAFQLKTYCLLCFGVDLLNLGALILVLSLKPESFSIHKPDFAKWKVMSPIVFASIFIAVISLKGFDTVSIPSSDLTDAANSVLNTPVLSVNSGDEFPSIGPKTAAITVVEFSDFQCPYCRIGAFNLNSIVDRYPGKIRVVFRNYPLDSACNPAVKQSAHPMACEAARYAICAHKQGKFEGVYQEFFDKQSAFFTTQPLELIKTMGMDNELLKSCASSAEVSNAIAKDIQDGTALDVKSTPTFFINGHKMEGAYPVPIWIKIVDKLLST